MNARDIYRAFGGKLHGTREMKRQVCRIVSILPEEIAAKVARDCWFLGSTEDAWAYTFRGDEIAGKQLIVLSDELFRQSDDQIAFTIIHEIGHVILGHRNSILVTQSAAEVHSQEAAADAFARQYL